MTVAVAIVVFLVAYDNGGFGESTRDMLAIVLWWALILCARARDLATCAYSAGRVVQARLLAAFGVWTLLSVMWAADAGARTPSSRG